VCNLVNGDRTGSNELFTGVMKKNIRGEAKIVDVVFKDLSRSVLGAGGVTSPPSPSPYFPVKIRGYFF
jgi:hypothetical protein